MNRFIELPEGCSVLMTLLWILAGISLKRNDNSRLFTPATVNNNDLHISITFVFQNLTINVLKTYHSRTK